MPALRNRRRKSSSSESPSNVEVNSRQRATRSTAPQSAIRNPIDAIAVQPLQSFLSRPSVSPIVMPKLELSNVHILPSTAKNMVSDDLASSIISRHVPDIGEDNGSHNQHQGLSTDLQLIVTDTNTTKSMSLTTMNSAIETIAISTEVGNQEAIAGALTKANHMLQENRAPNTKKMYMAKKKLWSTWCRQRSFADGETVTEGKLCLWLQEEVFAKGSQIHGERKGTMLSSQGVEGYIKPIVDLYEVRFESLLFQFDFH